MKKGTKEYYNDTASKWANDWYENELMLPFLKECKSYLKDKARVLDLGCNSGYETRRMKDLDMDVVGLDFSENSIEIAKSKNKDIDFVCDNMLNDLTYLGKFDAVIAIASIIHIKEKDLELCFQRIYEILNDDGYLFMVVRSEEGKLEESYKTFNDTKYDREIYGYNRYLFDEKMNNSFKFIKEITPHDEHWKYYCYEKSTNKI